MTQADRALHLLRRGYDPHNAPGWSRTFGDNYGFCYSLLRWIPTCQNESQAATRLHNIYNAFPGAEQMTPDYTDAPPEIAQAIEQSTIIKEIHNMPQPEITFRHGLCSASIYEQEFTPRRREIDRPHRQLPAQLFGQRRQLATHQPVR